jgi:pimeloyl-ACP methyl ester carboxylesterase
VREALADEPLTYLKKVRVPVLALVGSLDRIIPAESYVEAMQPVLASIPGSRVDVLPELNHLFQTAKTGSPQEFGTIEETISPVALKKIGDWVALQVKATR